MVVGQKLQAWIPAELAYKGVEKKPQGDVIYEIELVDILTDKVPASGK
jgi:FKBP-type peptidyl-prolyl cis-trans isomerase